ncbi:hypothetical protein F4861DRAFT_545146 [Xylaria intraflava]|nr:hypothetical protein F4861DRAFT_545146 [Xylaria intraflava]
MPDTQSFGRFGDFPAEIRLQIWEEHFSTFFSKSPCMHTVNGGCLSFDKELSSLRLITDLGRLTKARCLLLPALRSWINLVDIDTISRSMGCSGRHVGGRGIPILQGKTVIHNLPPVYWSLYTTRERCFDAWPKLKPLINREAFEAARTYCKRYDVLDLWLDRSTLNISQPCLADVASDVFRIDPSIARMMLGLNDAPWLARIRRLAIGPFKPNKQCDATSILRVLERTGALDEVYLLLSPEVVYASTRRDDMRAHDRIAVGPSSTEIGVAGRSEQKMKELRWPCSDHDDLVDAHYAGTLRTIAAELSRRCSSAKIKYGYIDV